MRKLYRFETPYGEFAIETDGVRFFSAFDDDLFASYATIDELLKDVKPGGAFPFAGAFQLTQLGLPNNLADWQRVLPTTVYSVDRH